MKNKKGQIVIILLLAMLVALAIGLTITQRSITDLTTSTRSEQSARAFSAAEAGIEKALSQGDVPNPADIPQFTLDTKSNATAKVTVADNLPRAKQALEFPPIGKGEIAQFWLANTTTPFNAFYTQNSVDIYFGNAGSAVMPASEITLIYRDTSNNYKSTKKFIDPDSSRNGPSGNGFEGCSPGGGPSPLPNLINTTSSRDTTDVNRQFLCKYSFDFSGITGFQTAIMIKVRVLYSDENQRAAVMPIDPGPSCVTPFVACSLPYQAIIYTSVGKAGESQKTLQVYKAKMIPSFFDYAVFSTGEIKK